MIVILSIQCSALFFIFAPITIALRISSSVDVAVIGSGVGGLLSASILGRSGCKVVLLEQRPGCGGRMNSAFLEASNKRYRFDTGPSLLLLPDVYKKTFDSLGERIEDHVELMRVDPFYRCFFEEDSSFADIVSDPDRMSTIVEKIEPGAFTKFRDYMSIAGDFLRFGLPAVIED
jgi:phytoene dehydrogenase-like protein